ncbi:MAG: minor capsid protein [Dorea formicigenerans]
MPKSNDYWRKREEENLRKNQISEAEYARQIQETYEYMLDQIQKEINGFYTKYATAEGISLAEAKRRVSKLDIEEYGRKAARYVKEQNFSKQANEEMRLYNATMKINRLELLKANIGLELVSGFDELQQYFDEKLTDRTLEEFKRQAGILGKTVLNNEKVAHAIVNASFKNATYSDRIWMYQSQLKAEMDKLLKEGLIQGKNPRMLARHLQKTFGASRYNAERLMVTELARVQTEAQKQSFIRNGFDEYVYVACGGSDVCAECKALDGKHFKVDDMMPGENASPMHPCCHCSVAAYMDDKAYEEWLNSYREHGLNFEDWKASRESEESKKKYKYANTVVKKTLLKSSSYRKKFNQVSGNTRVNRIAWNLSKDILEHRSGTKFEDLAFINVVSEEYAVNKDYDVESKAKMNKPMKKLLAESEAGTIVAIHNHPGSSVPSIPDLRACIQRGYQKGIIACHNGRVYIYSVDSQKYNEPIAMSALDRLEKKGYTEDVAKRLKDAGISLEVL